ncbi:MAG: TetR/AcrR family transcriptional regulator [Gammaproteobacteria bacterium]
MGTRDTQTRIVDAALELFNEFGTPAISTNKIADRCGISKGNLHYHFRTKQEVIRFLWQRAVDEMDSGWYHDHLAPTLEHMAVMFVRQLQLIVKYRFFYREMANLLRCDKVLRQRFADNRLRRIKDLERFFRTLAAQGHLRLPADERRLRSIIDITWVLSENWLNYLEFHDREVTADSISDGYHQILEVLQPYLLGDPVELSHQSLPTIEKLTTRAGGAA